MIIKEEEYRCRTINK